MSNTGALRPPPPALRAWSVDWLAYTCHSSRDLQAVLPWYVEEDWRERPSATNGYQITSEYAKGRLLRSSDLTLGIHADLPGQYLAEMRFRWGQASVGQLCGYIAEQKFTMTRLDVAIDEREGLVTYDRLRECQAAGGMVTRAKRVRWYEDTDAHSGVVDGWTCYVGAPSSRLTMRIYDKAAERWAKLSTSLRRGNRPTEHWTRVELQCRDEAATAVLKIIGEGEQVRVGKTFNTVLSCRIPSDHANHRRWREAQWWTDTIGALGTTQLGLQKPEYALDRAKAALFEQYAPTMAALQLAEEDQLALLGSLNKEGKPRLKAKHYRAIERVEEARDNERLSHT